jgi:hypothetical protein
MSGQIRRLVATAGAAALLGVGTMAFTAGTANASEPVVVGNCATSIKGAPGTPVSLDTHAVLAPVTNTISAIPLLGPPLAHGVGGTLSALPPIPIGAIPTGDGYISGGTIAHDVVGKLGPLGAALQPVLNKLTQLCGVTTHGLNAAAAPVQDGTHHLAQQSHRMFSPNPPPGSDGGGSPDPGAGTHQGSGSPDPGTGGGEGAPQRQPRAVPDPLGFPTVNGVRGGVPYTGSFFSAVGLAPPPSARYSNIPFALPGVFSPSPGVRYGGTIPGYAPKFSVLGTKTKTQPSASAGSDNPVRTAGSAEAIGGGHGPGGGVGLALLCAVLALSGVTAALVRTWILRKAGLQT